MVYTFSTFQACREFQPLLGLRRVGAKLVLCRHTSHGVTFVVRCGAVHANPKLHICPRHAWECDPARRDVLGSTRVGVGGKVIQAFSGFSRDARLHPVTFCCDFVSGNRIVYVARPLVVS